VRIPDWDVDFDAIWPQSEAAMAEVEEIAAQSRYRAASTRADERARRDEG